MLELFGAWIFIFTILILAFLIVEIVAIWKVFNKASKKGWESIIPVYSYWVLNEIAGLNWWWFLLLIIDVVFKIEIDGLTLAINLCGFFASFNCYYNIARKFGKDTKTSVLAGIFPFIFILIFGFSKTEVYDANILVSKNGIFGNRDINDNISKEYSEESCQMTDTVDTNGKKEYLFCGNCGTKLDSNVKFCPKCGKKKIN